HEMPDSRATARRECRSARARTAHPALPSSRRRALRGSARTNRASCAYSLHFSGGREHSWSYIQQQLLQQAIEMLADMRRLRGRMGQRNRLVEGDACFVGAAELVQPRTLGTEKVEVALELLAQRLDHFQRGGRAAQFRHCHCTIERDDL